MKYLVMECFTTYAVLLDEEGRFVKSANPGYEVGETVTNPVLMRDEPLEKVKGTRKVSNRIVAGIVAIAAMVALFFGANFYQQNYMPYSSIFMIINPEVEMVLNRSGEVLDVKGANADGNSLVEGYEPTSKDKTVVANELVDRAIEMGFLADGGQVSIAIDTPDQELFEKYGVELRRELDGRTTLTIQITDIENSKKPSETPVPPVEDDDSGYDEPDDDDDLDDEIDDDDSEYDELDDDNDDDDDDEAQSNRSRPASQSKPRNTSNQSNDDSGYDESDYDDSDYDDDDSEYDDDDDSDYDD